VHDHKTGRNCQCGGALTDTIINFGENLNPSILEEGFSHGERADVMLALGSSLRVNPAADMARVTSDFGNLVIVNL